MKVHEIELKAASVLPIHDADDKEHCEGWLIAPCGHTRDSDLVEECNHVVGLEMLAAVNPDGDDYEVLRFGHWGVGWIEEVVVRPGTKAHLCAQEMTAALANYPILSDDRHSEMETEAHAAGTCGEGCCHCEYLEEEKRTLVRVVTAGVKQVAEGLEPGNECDIRLQLYPDGDWAIRWGSSDYDQDHRGYWGASTVSVGDNYASIADDLVEQALDARAEAENE